MLSTIRSTGPLSRADISRETGLSKPTVSVVVKELLAAELVVEHGYSPSNGGRPGQLLSFNEHAGFIVAIDLGGTVVRAVLTTLEGNQLARLREPTETASPQGLINQVVGMVTRLASAAGVSTDDVMTMCIGMPGVVDDVNGSLHYVPNLPTLEGTDFLSRLRSQLHCSVEVFNDVNLAALGEYWQGAGKGLGTFAYVSIGTGLGVGLIAGGQLVSGSHGRAGELGYLRLSPTDPHTAEERLAGPAITEHHKELGGSGSPLDAFAEAAAGTGPGVQVIAELLPVLAWFCSAVALVLDPEVIILGGSIGLRLADHLEALTLHLGRTSPIVPRIAVAALGDDAGLKGAISMGIADSQRLLFERARG